MNWFVWAVVAAFFWGAAPVLAKVGLAKTDALVALTTRTLAIVVVLLLVNLYQGKLGAYRQLDSRTWLVLAAEGVFASGLGHYAYFAALKTADASAVSPITSSFPLVAVGLGALFLGERISPGKMLGILLIIFGLVVMRRY